MARPNITLRAEKGSALTFDEMDVNFSSFFYSASALTDNGASKLRLYYTGSSELDPPFNQPDYIEVLLPTAEQADITVGAAGNDREVQFNNGGSFGASPNLKFTQNSNEGSRLGIGIEPTSTLTLRSTQTTECTNLRISAASGDRANSKGFLTIDQGGTTIAQLGKIGAGTTKDISFISCEPISLGYANFNGTNIKKLRVTNQGVAIGSGISTNALSELSVQGTLTIGSALTAQSANYIGSSTIGGSLLPSPPTGTDPNTVGLLLQSPQSTSGGHVVIGINTNNSNRESFSVVRGEAGSFDCSIATFKADGNVGINQRNPIEKLHVEGNITGSGNINVKGTGTIAKIDEFNSLKNDWEGSNEEYARTLVKSSTGLVQYMDAAPVPKGGIIMWSGTIDNIPIGWRLCEAEVGSVNGIEVPDLSDRFIVAAGNGYDVGATGGSNEKFISTVNIPRMGTSQAGGHSHGYKDTMFTEEANNFSESQYIDNIDLIHQGASNRNSATDTTRSDVYAYSIDRCTESAGIHTHCIGTQAEDLEKFDVRPSYYALAFIIYVGKA